MADEPRDALGWEEKALKDGADVGEVWSRRDLEERLLDTQEALVNAIDHFREELAKRLEYRERDIPRKPVTQAEDALWAAWREFLVTADKAGAQLDLESL